MAKSKNPRKELSKENHEKKMKDNVEKLQEKPHSWALMRSFFTCKHLQANAQLQQQREVEEPEEQKVSQKKAKQDQKVMEVQESIKTGRKKMKCSGSLCNNTKVMQIKPNSTEASASIISPEDRNKKRGLISSSSLSTKSPLNKKSSSSSLSLSSSSTNGSSGLRGIPFRKLSGCYECRMVIDPVLMTMTKDPSFKTSISSCPQCNEIFMTPEYLELHQAVRHAVSELGPDDTSKNIVEIIFQSSWLKKQFPVCKIDRILKVQNTPKTISRFEEYRDNIKVKATKLPKKHPRCIADGNELLRFHCTTFTCSLGLNGSSNLCNSIPNCNICSIIKNGFIPEKSDKIGTIQKREGILTTATSGKAHDNARVVCDDEKRAMLVCRVIAGRVKKNNNCDGSLEEYDSVAGAVGMYSNLDELFVFNPRAILPCFVVIYRGF